MTTNAVNARDHVARVGSRKRDTFQPLAPGPSTSRGDFIATAVIGLVGAVAMFIRLFYPLPVGLANNGDGTYFSCQLGMQPILSNGASAAWSFAILDWKIVPNSADSACLYYPNAEVYILRAAQWFSTIFGAPDTVNLRFVMIGYCLVVGAVLALVAHIIRRGLATRIVIAAALFIVLADATFADYAGSTYGEFPGIIGIIVMSVAAVYTGLDGGKRWLGILLFTVGAAAVILSTSLAVTLIIPIVIFLLVQTFRRLTPRLRTRRSGGIREGGGALSRVVAFAAAAALVLLTVWTVSAGPTNYQTNNPYHVITFGILGNSNDRKADLESMDLPVTMARFANTSVWAEDSIINYSLWEQVKGDITYAKVAEFFLTHPDRAWIVANSAANAYHAGRPSYLGTYTPDSGEEGQTLETRVTLVSSVMRMVSDLGVIPLLVFWAFVIWGGIRALRTGPIGSARRAFGGAAILMASFSIVQFLTAAFGDGIETTKHMVFAMLAAGIGPVMLLACLLELPQESPQASESELPQAAPVRSQSVPILTRSRNTEIPRRVVPMKARSEV